MRVGVCVCVRLSHMHATMRGISKLGILLHFIGGARVQYSIVRLFW